MIYRKLSSTGDYTFGKQAGNFYANSPATVAQAIQTRLLLIEGEWFQDPSVGTPYDSQILGMNRLASYDQAIKTVILDTQGVNSILAYASGVNPSTRKAAVACTVDTVYGSVSLSGSYSYQSSGQLLDINFVLNSSLLG